MVNLARRRELSFGSSLRESRIIRKNLGALQVTSTKLCSSLNIGQRLGEMKVAWLTLEKPSTSVTFLTLASKVVHGPLTISKRAGRMLE
jgi:hypothetical protein